MTPVDMFKFLRKQDQEKMLRFCEGLKVYEYAHDRHTVFHGYLCNAFFHDTQSPTENEITRYSDFCENMINVPEIKKILGEFA